jgi:hypothetical protein
MMKNAFTYYLLAEGGEGENNGVMVRTRSGF